MNGMMTPGIKSEPRINNIFTTDGIKIESKINILAISTSEIKLSVIIDEENTLDAVKKLHTTFDLD